MVLHPLIGWGALGFYRSCDAEIWYIYYLGGAQSIALGFVPLAPKFDSAPLCTPSWFTPFKCPRELNCGIYTIWGVPSRLPLVLYP